MDAPAVVRLPLRVETAGTSHTVPAVCRITDERGVEVVRSEQDILVGWNRCRLVKTIRDADDAQWCASMLRRGLRGDGRIAIRMCAEVIVPIGRHETCVGVWLDTRAEDLQSGATVTWEWVVDVTRAWI